MSIGVIGQKCGMTRLFQENGESVPVTVIKVDDNRITQIKRLASDGYAAVQVTTGQRKQQRLTKPEIGHFAKAGVEAGVGLWEFRTDEASLEADENLQVGANISVTRFNTGELVDVVGTSKGKGFAGAVKRHNFATQDATHGNSLSHRAPGSIGQNQSPGRVFKGKKMAGQMGNKQVTVQSQAIAKIDEARSLILIKGNVPGATGNYVMILPAEKASVTPGGEA